MSPVIVYDVRTSASSRSELTANQLSQKKVRASFPVWVRPIELDLNGKQAHTYAGHFVMTSNWQPVGRNSMIAYGLVSAYNEHTGEESRARARLTVTSSKVGRPKLSLKVTS